MSARVAVFRAIAPLLASACVTFSPVRSAEVTPGLTTALHVSASSAPGEAAGTYFRGSGCSRCDSPLFASDLGFTYGWQRDGGVGSVALGAGVSGLEAPYFDGYVQLATGPRQVGVGARVGRDAPSRSDYQLYTRYDVPLGAATRLLLNPGFFLQEGPRRGTFKAFVLGIGALLEGEWASVTPALTLVAARVQREEYTGILLEPRRAAFGVASLGVTIHRPRKKWFSTPDP